MNAFEATPVILHADASRIMLKLPLILLGGGVVVSIVVLLLYSVLKPSHGLSNAAMACTRIGPICAVIFAYVRWVYVRRTILSVDRTGLTLRQPFSSRRVEWNQVTAIQAASPLSPTHRGGVQAAARLTLRDDAAFLIPDVFSLHRAELVEVLQGAFNNR